MPDQWYVSREGQRYGPYTWEQLVSHASSGNVGDADLLWSDSSGGWQRADQVPGLLPAARPAGGPSAPSGKRRAVWIAAGVLLLALGVAVACFLVFRAPSVEAAARKVESALKAADVDALVALTHPSQREGLKAALSIPAEEMPQVGEGFANRKVLQRDREVVLYEVSMGEHEFFVEFILDDGAWWLSIP